MPLHKTVIEALIAKVKKLIQRQMGKSIVRTERNGLALSKAKNRKEAKELEKELSAMSRPEVHEGKKQAAESFRKTFRENKRRMDERNK
jgi:hypothetical protein